jgi:dihydroorotase
MTLYLTNNTQPDEIVRAQESGIVHAVKLYPAGATTNSDAGVTDLANCYKTLEKMQEVGMPFLVHGEVTDQDIDLFDREAVFIERVMRPLRRDFPALNIVFEHITTKHAAQYVAEAEGPIAATITAHHLLYNRNDIFKGGIRPHYYCLPVLKREEHRLALVTAATSGDERFFLGTDSAPHAKGAKEGLRLRRLLHRAARDGAVCRSLRTRRRAGQAGSLRLAERPGLLQPAGQQGKITLKREQWTLPEALPLADQQVIPLNAGETINWKMV